MHPHQQRIEIFYSAFARLDAQTMAQCYAEDASFEDEVFSLQGRRDVAGMWRMLCQATQAKGADVWQLKYRDLQADAAGGRAHYLLGWTPLLRDKVRTLAGASLRNFLAKEPA